MTTIRDIKRQARRDLHARMQIAAVYIRAPGVAPVTVHVRLHNHWGEVGDIRGSRTYPAQAENLNPKMIFDLTEIATNALVPGGTVSLEAGEAYKIDHVMPADDEFQTVAVIRLKPDLAAGLPLPPPDDTTFDTVTIPTVAEEEGASSSPEADTSDQDACATGQNGEWVDPGNLTPEEEAYLRAWPPNVNGGTWLP